MSPHLTKRKMSQSVKVNPQNVVEVAREYLGAPYLWQGRSGKGLDCIGLPIVVCQDLSLGEFDILDYGRTPSGQLKRRIGEVCTPLLSIRPGSLLIFKISVVEQHCAIASHYRDGWGMIHASDAFLKVVEHRLTKDLEENLVAVYGLPGVKYD